MKKLLTILLLTAALNSGAQNIWRAPSVFEQPVNFKAAISQTSGTDSLKITTVGTNTTLLHGKGAIGITPTKVTIGNSTDTGYIVSAGEDRIKLQQGSTDSIIITFSGDTAHVNATVAAWDFVPPLPGGGGGSGWSLTGNSGTDSTNFLGTIDNQPLFFRQNDSAYGYLSNTNVAIGFNAGQQLTESIGVRNVFIGYEAGRYDGGGGPKTADDNIGIGNQTLLLNKGLSNIAIGPTALDNNITGNQNICIGEGAKTFTDSTSEALAIGNNAVASANQIKFSQIYDSLSLDLGTFDVPCVGCVLTNVDGVGSASWQPSNKTPLDSASIYALTPTLGTQYYCTDCTGNGITGRIVAYIGAAWRRLLFED